jgi:arylsulfatase A-like enzyme
MTIPKALKQANNRYRCAHFGKWGENMISTPEQCEYDASDGMTGNITGGMPKSLGIESGNHNDGPPHFVDNEDPKRTASVTDRAIDFMREQSDGDHPFFVQVSYYAVHLSVVCRQQTLDKYQKKGEPDRGYTQAWAAMLEELDTGVGRLVDALDDLGIADNTYVFFTADNGGRGTVPGGSDRPTNTPLTGAKHSLYEGGIRVPFMVRGPGIRAGSLCHLPVVGYDFLPTFYDLAGGEASLGAEIDGVSFRRALAKPDIASLDRPQSALFFHRPRRAFSAIRQGDYKLMLFWNAAGKVRASELYRVDPDPREENFEISAREPAKAKELRNRLVSYLRTVNAETRQGFTTKPERKRAGKNTKY